MATRAIVNNGATAALKASLADPTAFWGKEAARIDWIKPPTTICELTELGTAKWFQGGTMNTAYNCLDRHVKAGRGNDTALIYDSPVTDTIKKYSFNELLDKVSRLSSYLRSKGVGKGDRVIVYMPNIPEAAISMLACARIGAIHSVVFGGFAAPELATRIKDSRPKVILASSCGIDGKKVIDYKVLLDAAIELSNGVHKVESTLIFQRDQKPCPIKAGFDFDWSDELAKASPNAPCEEVAATDPLYVLYTSGTTGQPKGVVRENGGHAVALSWALENVYAVQKGETFWAASDVGWVVGHSFSVYAPLLNGVTTVLYEGKPIGTPDAGNFWRVLERHGVNAMFTAPTAIRAIKRVDENGELAKQFDLSKFRTLFLAGERADPDSLKWAENSLQRPVRDHWWQTETGWPITANVIGLEGYIPVKYGSAFRATPGYDIQVLDDEHKAVPAGKLGAIAIKLPLPPGVLGTLYNAPERFKKSYLDAIPGYYDTGDAGFIDEEGYVYIMARTDDVINVAGHRLSSGAMEEIISDHPDVAEVAVVGAKDEYKGHVPLGLMVLNSSFKKDVEQIKKEVVAMVRERIGPVASFKDALIVDRLPKTRSGKVLRATLRAIANGDEYKVPATIEDESVLKEVEKIINEFHEKDEGPNSVPFP